jgi:NADH-quinone oxidoreductase subunit A
LQLSRAAINSLFRGLLRARLLLQFTPVEPRKKRGAPVTSIAMLQNYLPILIFFGVATALGLLLMGLGFLFGPRKPDAEKLSAYECGFDAFEDSRMKFDVRYYLVAIVFIVFDLEIAFLFPWAVSLGSIGAIGIGAMGLFLLILVIGFVYEWKKGALEWD